MRCLSIALLCVICLESNAQSTASQVATGYDKHYKLLRSGSITADKNFYLLLIIGRSPEVARLLSSHEVLANLFRKRLAAIKNTTTGPYQAVRAMCWSREDSMQTDAALRALYTSAPAYFDRMINQHLRTSGYYQRYVALGNADLLLKAWADCLRGMNVVVGVYALGNRGRYPAIDSASYDVRGSYYQYMLKNLLAVLDEQSESMTLFYQPSLQLVLKLLHANDRHEAAQFEPLEEGQNKLAVTRLKRINWEGFTYSAILVPGEGPEIPGQSLSPGGRLRCELAAARFKKGMAPFIMVSGGNCHPFHTPFNEAIEMKQYLVNELAVPPNAIIIEPQARHTTTNFRNANRLMIRYGLPMDKAALCVTTIDQATYIDHPGFDARNRKELGYLPYRDKKRLSVHELSFYPVLESLHMDPSDPLDP